MDARNEGRAADEDNFVYIHLVDLRVLEHLFYGLNSRTEEVLAQLRETSTGDGGVEVDFDGRPGGRGECSFRTCACGAETAECPRVRVEIIYRGRKSAKRIGRRQKGTYLSCSFV